MKRLLFNITSISYLTLILLGIIKFSLWGQVVDLYEAGSLDQLSALTEHPHYYRFLLVVPVYKIANILALPPDYIFSIACGLMILAIARLLSSTLNALIEEKGSLVILAAIIGLSLLMNGRIIFALLSMSILLKTIVYWHTEKSHSYLKLFASTFMALWLSSVSSGTMTVVYVTIIILLLDYIIFALYNMSIQKIKAVALIIFSINLYLYSNVIVVFLEKNVLFYGGYWEVMAHGAGKILVKAGTFGISFAVLLVVLLAASLVYSYLKMTDARPLIIAIVASFAGGLFGFSTLTMAFPPLLLLLLYLLRSRQHAKQLTPSSPHY